MDSELSKKLEDNGIDVVKTMERFMNNDDLFLKFLRRFLDDRNYLDMIASIIEKDYEKAFNYAHTLKGLSANLGMNCRQNPVSTIVSKLRMEQYDDIAKDMEDLNDNYENICEIIRSL